MHFVIGFIVVAVISLGAGWAFLGAPTDLSFAALGRLLAPDAGPRKALFRTDGGEKRARPSHNPIRRATRSHLAKTGVLRSTLSRSNRLGLRCLRAAQPPTPS